MSSKEPIKKVIAQIQEVYVEPDYYFVAHCPYCDQRNTQEVFEDNFTVKIKCFDCEKDFKVKVPKFL